MCGIAGILATDRAREPDRMQTLVRAMLEAMVHRGPDQGGDAQFNLSDQSLVLGARRLAIQDLTSAGSQPMFDPVTGNVIVFNGEIYNFRELRQRAVAEGARVTSGSDTEVILRGYALWGPGVVERLRGMFAFAIWDRRQEALFLARDRLGVKPLYYCRTPGSFAFASEIRAFLEGSVVPGALNPDAIRSYLAFGAVSEPVTIIQKVRAIPPGHYAYARKESLDLTQYWSCAQTFRTSGSVASRDELDRKVEAIISESVKLRMISDAPMGVFLSGGIDSTIIAALAARHATQPIRSVSLVFRERELSEKAWIDRTVSHLGTNHSEVELSDSELLNVVSEALAAYDQPTIDALNTFVVSMHARRAGLTVALSGIGADELFGGYPAFRQLPTLRAIRRTVPAVLLRPSVALYGRLRINNDRARKLAEYLLPTSANGIAAEFVHRELFANHDRRMLTSAFAASPVSDMGEGLWIPPELDAFNALSYCELNGYLLNMLLRDTDFTSMASSLEVREPYLDHELVATIAALPGSAKQGPDVKWLLRRVARRILPERLIQSTKRGFSLPMDRWIRGDLRREVDGVLRDRNLSYALSQIVSQDAVERIWSDFNAGRTSWTRPWALYVLKSWAGVWAD